MEPCDICGSLVDKKMVYEADGWGADGWVVECSLCGNSGPLVPHSLCETLWDAQIKGLNREKTTEEWLARQRAEAGLSSA